MKRTPLRRPSLAGRLAPFLALGALGLACGPSVSELAKKTDDGVEGDGDKVGKHYASKPMDANAPWPYNKDRCGGNPPEARTPLSDDEHAANLARAAQDANVFPGVGANGVTLGMSKAEVEEAMGKPHLRTSDVLFLGYSYSNMRLHYQDDKVVAISAIPTTDETFGTQKDLLPSGVGTGATFAQVRAVLGEPVGINGNMYSYEHKGVLVYFYSGVVQSFTVVKAAEPLDLPIMPGIGVGPAKLGTSCKSIVEAMGTPFVSLRIPDPKGKGYGRQYRFGADDISLDCGEFGDLHLITLSSSFAGTTPEGLGFDHTAREFAKAGYDLSKAPPWGNTPNPQSPSGLFLQEDCDLPNRVRLMQVMSKSAP